MRLIWDFMGNHTHSELQAINAPRKITYPSKDNSNKCNTPIGYYVAMDAPLKATAVNGTNWFGYRNPPANKSSTPADYFGYIVTTYDTATAANASASSTNRTTVMSVLVEQNGTGYHLPGTSNLTCSQQTTAYYIFDMGCNASTQADMPKCEVKA